MADYQAGNGAEDGSSPVWCEDVPEASDECECESTNDGGVAVSESHWVFDMAKNLAEVSGIDYDCNKAMLITLVSVNEAEKVRLENAELRTESQSLSARLKRIEDVIWNVK